MKYGYKLLVMRQMLNVHVAFIHSKHHISSTPLSANGPCFNSVYDRQKYDAVIVNLPSYLQTCWEKQLLVPQISL